MGTRIGAIKCAAKRCGITYEDYLRNLEAGLARCFYCNTWLSLDSFQKTTIRANSCSSMCKACKKIWDQTPKGRFSTYKCKAKNRKIQFCLSFEEFMVFWNQPCYYCGLLISGIGIDRLDNALGYTVNNSVPCCWTCNAMKQDHSLTQWFSHMSRVLENSSHLF
jgi:hypothetical protein